MENPFQFGRELGAEELVDREEEVAQVTAAIRDGGKLILIGPRRYGKTSILKAVISILNFALVYAGLVELKTFLSTLPGPLPTVAED